MRTTAGLTNMFVLVRIAPCLALLGLASAAAAQHPGPGEWGMRAPTLEPLSEAARRRAVRN